MITIIISLIAAWLLEDVYYFTMTLHAAKEDASFYLHDYHLQC